MKSIEKMEKEIRTAHENGIKYLVLGLSIYKNKEMTLIGRDDYIDKLEYIKKTYDENLVMKGNENIKISHYVFSDEVIINKIDISQAM